MEKKKKMEKLKGRPLGKTVVVTLDTETQRGNIILSADMGVKGNNKGLLKEDQTVVSLGNEIKDELKVGDKVRVNFEKYRKKVAKPGVSQGYNMVLDIPTIEIDGKTYGRISLFDIIWVFD